MFLYENLSREIDIEFSQVLANPHNAQYVIQPYTVSGNIIRFDMPRSSQTSHRIKWREDYIDFTSWRGFSQNPITDSLIFSWHYTGPNIPPPGNERLRFNLWLFGGNPPQRRIGDEIVIKSFNYSQELTDVDDQNTNSRPSQFIMNQNYPNPFNPFTVIPYQLPHEGQVIIQVMNTLGQVVAIMDEGRRVAGQYKIKFDGLKLSSGVYFYSILIDGRLMNIKKMVLMK